MPRSVLGLDIGGANLKAAHTDGGARLLPFELWKAPARLPAALRALLEQMPALDLLAVTMTGELCDCFETKRQGVEAILDAVTAVAGQAPVRVWRTDGRLVGIEEARRTPLLTAAANWLALAIYAGRFAPEGPALLLDLGSTTTDIVPLLDGRPVPRGRTDAERLRCGELVYTGIRRTPVCALVGDGVAAELFATTLDVYLALEYLPEDPLDRGTADGRPATRAGAHARLARMLGGDGETCPLEETRDLARRAAQEQIARIRAGLKRVADALPGPPRTVIVSGSGELVAREVVQGWQAATLVSLAEKLGPAVSQAACAYALAVLAAEQAGEEG
ncbi:MAG TPA: hydantoinase/oxoprolinase family protein [Gemmataceae bacterium]|jgi:probable H4MPT-linked C1 transfer pathway protein|nr:hydantoinase/oxoprolinase family protein [Gemmataceae bacterium]